MTYNYFTDDNDQRILLFGNIDDVRESVPGLFNVEKKEEDLFISWLFNEGLLEQIVEIRENNYRLNACSSDEVLSRFCIYLASINYTL